MNVGQGKIARENDVLLHDLHGEGEKHSNLVDKDPSSSYTALMVRGKTLQFWWKWPCRTIPWIFTTSSVKFGKVKKFYLIFYSKKLYFVKYLNHLKYATFIFCFVYLVKISVKEELFYTWWKRKEKKKRWPWEMQENLWWATLEKILNTIKWVKNLYTQCPGRRGIEECLKEYG